VGVPFTNDARLLNCSPSKERSGAELVDDTEAPSGYVKAFKKFNRGRAAFSADDVERLLGDVDIIRHRGKIESTINNAGAVLALQNKVRVSRTPVSFVDNKRCNEIGARTKRSASTREARS